MSKLFPRPYPITVATRKRLSSFSGRRCRFLAELQLDGWKDEKVFRLMLNLDGSYTSVTDSSQARSKARTSAPLPFTSEHNSSPKNPPKTAVLVFGSPFLPTCLAKQKSRNENICEKICLERPQRTRQRDVAGKQRRKRAVVVFGVLCRLLSELGLDRLKDEKILRLILSLNLSSTSVTDPSQARSKALTSAPLPFTSEHNSSPKYPPKTAVLVFGSPFLPTFLAKQKSRNENICEKICLERPQRTRQRDVAGKQRR